MVQLLIKSTKKDNAFLFYGNSIDSSPFMLFPLILSVIMCILPYSVMLSMVFPIAPEIGRSMGSMISGNFLN